MPGWLKFDKTVLKFFGYFKEAVNESNDENFRIRQCTLMFYLEDDSVEVLEPRIENSGMPQGAFVKRHRMKKRDGSAYTPSDFMVEKEVEIYSRVFKIIACDAATRQYFSREFGVQLQPDTACPEDPYNAKRKLMGTSARGIPLSPRGGSNGRAAGVGMGIGGGGELFYGKKNNPMKRFMEASLGNSTSARTGVDLSGGRGQFQNNAVREHIDCE
jgi:hypothetical protein